MLYNDVDSDLPPFNDTIDGEEIFLFSNAKTSSSNGTSSFLHEDDDEHLRHQHHHNVVASSSSHHHHHHHHLPVDVDELLLNSNFLEPPNCDQSEDPLFWNCKGISDDHLSEFLPQSQLNLSNNSNNGTVVSTATTTAATSTSVANNAIVTSVAINDNNNNNSSTNISINQQPTQILSLDNQHSQRIIPIHHLQTQPTQISQQQIHIQQQHIRLQHNQIQQHQPQQVAVLQQQQSTQLQLQSSHQTGFQQQHQIIQQQQHEQYQTKWITLIPTGGDQYQTFSTAQQPQFFDKIPQQQQGLIQTEIVVSPATTLQQASLSTSIDTSHEPLTLIQQHSSVRITQQQPPQQQRQQQIQIQIQPPQQSATPFQQQLISEIKPEVSPGSTNATNNTGSNTTNCGDNNNNINNAAILKKDLAAKSQKSKEKQTRLDCPYCKRSFSKNFDLQQHMRCHTGEKPFQCIVCGRGFAQKSNVKKHMQAHKVWPEGPNNPSLPSNHGNTRSRNNSASSSIGTPRDDECMQENESLQINDSAVNSNGITLGLSNDKKNDGNDIFAENRYSCSYCQFNGRTYFELKSHLTIHKREKVFKCIVSSCGKTFSGSDLQGFLDHVTGHKDLIYHCHLCSGQFYSLDEFGEHQKHHSTAQMKRTSNQQASQSQSQHPQAHVAVLNPQNNTSLRQQNQQVVSTQLQPQQNQRQYNQQQQTQTQQLNNTQKSNQLYNSQQQSKANQKFFRCTKCMNRYTTQTALDHHLSISTHNFPCTECNKVFMCERYLRRHLNTHTAVQYVCTFCDKQFRTAAYLKMHSVVHTGEKPFRCNLCEAAFNRRDKLNRHKLTHEPVKKFKCPFKPHIGCTKEFNRPDKLKAHVLTHSGIRPHPCDLCSRTFSRLSRLREHKKLHHASQKDLSQQNQKVFESGEPNPGGGKLI